MKKLRCAAALLLTAAMLLPCFAATVSGVGGSGEPWIEQALDILDKEYWGGDGVTVVQRSANGRPAVSVSPAQDTDGTDVGFFADFEPMDLSGCRELVIDIMLRGTAEKYTVTAVPVSGQSRGEAYTREFGKETEKLYITLSEDIAKSLDRIEFSVSGSDGALTYAVVYSVSADSGYTYIFKDTFMSESVECNAGTAEVTKDGIGILPDGGKAELSTSFDFDTHSDSSYVLWITARGLTSGTVDVLAYDVSGDSEPVPSSGAQALMAGVHTYAFIIKSAFENPVFVFEGLGQQESTDGFTVTGAGIAAVGDNYDQSAGSITSCEYKNGSVTVSGALSNEASVTYVGSKLGVYAIPVWEDPEEVCSGEPDATVSFSTRFSVTFTPTENYACCMYLAVIITDEGNIPLGAPQFVSTPSPSGEVGVSVSALDGADSAGVFEANISSSVINIYTDRLFEGENIYSASLYTYSNENFYFDSDYLAEIEKRLTLAASAGVRVYVRLLTSSDGTFSYDTGDRDSVMAMCAVASLLSTRFDSIRGFILGEESMQGYGTNNVPDFVQTEKWAYLASIFTLCVRSSGTAQEVYLPFSDAADSDPSPLFAAVRYKMAAHSKQSISVLYTCPSDGDPLSTAVSVSHAASVSNACGYTADSSAAVWASPNGAGSEETASKYIEYCRTAANSGLRFAAMSVENLENPDEFYDFLKAATDRENIFSASVEQFKAIEENIEFSGECDIWNFTNAYDTFGWVAGGGFSSAVTSRSNFDGRALAAVNESGAGKAGILICRLASPVNMTNTSLKITVGITGTGSEPADITVIVGGRDLRAEFSAIAEYGKQTELICNMSGFSGAANIDYVAIIVRSEAQSVTELSSIKLCSLTVPQQELKARLGSETDSGAAPVFLAALIVLAAVTVTVFILLSRRRTYRQSEKTDTTKK